MIPAHNESQVIGRLLGQLIPAAAADELNVLVVANGCTDDTAEVAASYGPGVRVLSVPVASKHAALTASYDLAADYPRIYVDADVELRACDVRALAAALRQPGVLAAARSGPWPRPAVPGRCGGSTTSGPGCPRSEADCGGEA